MRKLRIPRELQRTCPITVREVEGVDGGNGKVYEFAMSSETPVEREDWFGDRWIEILDHGTNAVNLTRVPGAAVFVDHRGDQVGVIESARIDSDHVLRGQVRFSDSQRGQDIERDIQRGIRRNASIGYWPREWKLTETRDNVNTYRATQWELLELSVVGIPADVTVGVGRQRSEDPPNDWVTLPVNDAGDRALEGKMKKVRNERGELIEVADDDPRPAATAGDDRKVVESVVDNSKRARDIAEAMRQASLHGVPSDVIYGWIERGLSPDEMGRETLKAIATRAKAQAEDERVVDLGEDDVKSYSYARAILMGAGMRAKGRDEDKVGVPFSGLEAEVHRELERTVPAAYRQHGGVLVPLRLGRKFTKRTLDSKTATAGAETVFDTPGELIELLRKQTIAIQLGVRVLTGLSGPVAFPKQTGTLTVYWVPENPGEDVDDSDVSFGLVTLMPKTLQGTTAFSRQLLAQSIIDIEALVREELALAHSLAIDYSIFYGSGANGQPTGLYNAPDVQEHDFSGGVPDYGDLIDMIVKVRKQNALRGTTGWAVSTQLAGVFMKTLDFPSTGTGRPMWTGTFDSGVLAGYPAASSNQLKDDMGSGDDEVSLIFGNWRDAIMATFGAMELVVDPYALKKQALVEVTSFQMADHVIRHGESFIRSLTAKATGS